MWINVICTLFYLFSSPVGPINLIVILFFRDLAQYKGTSVRKLKETSVRRSLIPEKQPRTTGIHVINHSPGSPTSTPEHAITVNIGDTICIYLARGSTTCDFGVVTGKWNTKVNIIYLNKSGNTLSIWKLPGEKNYEDSVHINTIFYFLGNNIMSVTSSNMKDIK